MGFREAGWPSEFVYDEEHDLFRFAYGEFAFWKSTRTSNGCGSWASSGSVGRDPLGALALRTKMRLPFGKKMYPLADVVRLICDVKFCR